MLMFKQVRACGKRQVRHALIGWTATLFFQNREAQSEMPQEAAAQTGGTDRPPSWGVYHRTKQEVNALLSQEKRLRRFSETGCDDD
jgi:hypothetical protein